MDAARFRPSALPRLEKCPASGALPAVFTEGSEAAEHGSRVHALLDEVVKTGVGPAWALRLLEEVDAAGSVVSRLSEVPLSHGDTSGTADYVSFEPGALVATVCDWKAGRTPVYPDSAQLAWYALALAEVEPRLREVRVVVAQLQVSEDLKDATWALRERVLDALDLAVERDRLAGVRSQYLDAVKVVERGATPDVREGAHCEYCPSWDACPAKTRAISTLAQVRSLPVIQVTRETAGEVYSAIEAFRAVLDDAEKAVKELARSGPVPLPDGRELWAVEETRESVEDVDAAVKVLAEVYGDEAAEAVETKRSLSKGKIEALAKKHAEGRTGTAKAKEAVAMVRAAGAMKTASFLKFVAKERKAG